MLIANYSNALVYDIKLAIDYYKFNLIPQNQIKILPPGFFFLEIKKGKDYLFDEFLISADVNLCKPLTMAKNIKVTIFKFTDAAGIKWSRANDEILTKL